jgi:hypothetical protein
MSKKKSTIKKAPVESVVEQPIDPPSPEEIPSVQLEEPVQTESEPVAEVESTRVAEPEKSAEIEPQPVIEVVVEPAPTVEPVAEVKPPPIIEPTPTSVPPAKPKPLTMTSLHAEIEALRQIVDQQAILIKQLMVAPVKQRKSPLSNGKVQIKDTLTGKIYPSKNNVYQSLLKAGELKSLVDANVFGTNPEKNSFGCYNLFRAYPNRFVEVKPEEIKV